MKVLALDLSTSSGWAFFQDARLVAFDTVSLEKTLVEYGEYPYNYLLAADDMRKRLQVVIEKFLPDVIVVEETNLGFSRYSQKILEQIHCLTLQALYPTKIKVVYLSSSSWRKALGLIMTKEDKKNNAKLSKAKSEGKDKKTLGIKGKITKKHLSVRYVNEKFGLTLKMKDNDIADAISLAAAYLTGNALVADGLM